jgi:hypothetical protein
MMYTTITVTKAIPMRPGEILRIKDSDGKTPWRKYVVGPMLSDTDHKTTFEAQMFTEPRY